MHAVKTIDKKQEKIERVGKMVRTLKQEMSLTIA
jgi:hypothetical protein